MQRHLQKYRIRKLWPIETESFRRHLLRLDPETRQFRFGTPVNDKVYKVPFAFTGTIDSLTDASDFVRVMQKRTGQIIGSPEKVAYEQGFITADELASLAAPLKKSGYGEYLLNVR